MTKMRLTPRHILGVAILGLVVVLWVASSFLMRSIFGDGQAYDKPFFVTWLNTGTFSFYLVAFALRRGWRAYAPESVRDGAGRLYEAIRRTKSLDGMVHNAGEHDNQEPVPTGISSPLLQEGDASHRSRHHARPTMDSRPSVLTFSSEDRAASDAASPLTALETAKLGCVFSLLWFAANYFGNCSLAYTTVASFTIISSLSGFFTLALGAVVRVEVFTRAKLLALVASLLGVALVVMQDTHGVRSDAVDDPTPLQSSGKHGTIWDVLLGDALALVGAMLYGAYTVFLKLRVGHEDRVSMPLFFGFVGLFNLVFLWPILVILDLTGAEPFALPDTRDVWVVVVVNATITFVSDYLWVWAMLLTSPLVVTVGISMSIPLALVGDHFLYHYTGSWVFLLGATLVFASFIVVNLEHRDEAASTTNSPRDERD